MKREGTGVNHQTAAAREVPSPKGTAGPPFDKLRTDGQCRPLEGVARSAAGVFHHHLMFSMVDSTWSCVLMLCALAW